MGSIFASARHFRTRQTKTGSTGPSYEIRYRVNKGIRVATLHRTRRYRIDRVLCRNEMIQLQKWATIIQKFYRMDCATRVKREKARNERMRVTTGKKKAKNVIGDNDKD